MSFSDLRAGDIVGTSSRALGSLVKAGISHRRPPPRLWASMMMRSDLHEGCTTYWSRSRTRS